MNISVGSLKNRIKSILLRYTNRMELFHELDYPKHKIYLCDNVRISSCSKEPDTVRWIEGFKKTDIAFDIGANVGAYSLIMSIYSKKVFSIEPSVTNFRLLSKNITTNVKRKTVENNIVPFNIGLADKTSLETLSYVNLHEGKSGHQIRDRRVDGLGREFTPCFQHEIMCFDLDSLIETFAIGFPNHIKLDVDGVEYLILKGAKKTLQRPELKSLLVEVNENSGEEGQILRYLDPLGLKFKGKFEASPGNRIYNYLFTK